MRDLTNLRVGKLTVKRKLEKRRRKSIVWECLCDCGKVIKRSSTDIIEAHKRDVNSACTKSCAQVKDYSGQRVGNLVAIKPVKKAKNGKSTIWEFRCDCGNTIERDGPYIMRGAGVTHCGCIPRPSHLINLTGKKFGKLTVIEYAKTDSYHAEWLCQCDCGNAVITTGQNLKRGKTHCGCVKRTGSTTVGFYKDISVSYWNRLKRGAEQRSLEFNIDIEYAWKIFLKQNKLCPYTGTLLKFDKNSVDQNASLDRIDSSEGYIKGNLQWVRKDVNIFKMALSESCFLNLCEEIYEHRIKNVDRRTTN